MTQDKQKILTFALIGASMILALVGAFFGVKLPYPEPPIAVESRGLVATDIRELNVDHDLTVGGTLTTAGVTYPSTLEFEGATANAYETTVAVVDPTADRTVTIPNATGYVMVGASAGKYVIGVNTVTTTLTITHGLTTPQAAFCTLIQDSEANGATCTTTIDSGAGTVVLKLWKADGATAGSVGKQIAWMVTGQP
jgi:hypothetical protein